VFIDQALIQYRQHSNNTIGAQKRAVFSVCTKFSTHLTRFKKSQQAVIKQAIAFKAFEQKKQIEPDKTISILSGFDELSRNKKIAHFFNGNVTRSHFLGRLALLISLLTNKRQ